MMQEDSNGESTFEFVDKKSDNGLTQDKMEKNTESGSGMSLPLSAGSLLSNVPPPSELPSFISPPADTVLKPVTTQAAPIFHETKFSPVIPQSKGAEMVPPLTQDVPAAGDSGSGSNSSGGLFDWVKGAVGSGSLLSKVAERAKNSVDSMITTLDPQMREFLHSGGDIDIVVASDKEIKISPVREAFQAVFGKATVTGLPAQAVTVAAQPVGYGSAFKAAEERIHSVRTSGKIHENQPVVAVENFIVEAAEGQWYDLGLLTLDDPGHKITLHTFTGTTPVPSTVVDLARDDTPSDYPLLSSGYAVTIGSLMASNLEVHHSEWHQAVSGVSRRDHLLLAARVLAGLYKNSIGSML
ncbi:protein PRRC1-like [Schistocerca gregaria]|uniref:protein PRRC1-like n=1 Tax=Schistocerca gregaria TaxID=7010 RepID=UPI00211DB698|nr:protein PRRC1-like [Schistocerca gregaria]